MRILPLVFLALLCGTTGHAFDPGSVLVVVNSNYPASLPTAQYYMARRGIPAENLCTVSCSYGDWIDCQGYYAIESGIRAWFDAHPLAENRICYIVLSKGLPALVNGWGEARIGSVDSALCWLLSSSTYGRDPLYLTNLGTSGSIHNPYSTLGSSDFRTFRGTTSAEVIEDFPLAACLHVCSAITAYAGGANGLLARWDGSDWQYVSDPDKGLYRITNRIP
jgi:hypothetical protein